MSLTPAFSDPSPASITAQLIAPINFDSTIDNQYKNITDILTQQSDSGNLPQYLAQGINIYSPGLLADAQDRFTPSDFEGVTLQAKSPAHEYINLVYGHTYSRPILSIPTEKFEIFCKKIGHLAIPDAIFVSMGFSKPIPLIPTNSTGSIHELKHSIDPNKNKRQKKNKVIEEIFAFIEIKVQDLSTDIKFRSNAFDELGLYLKEAYFNQYKSVFADEKDFEDFVDDLISTVNGLCGYFNKQQIDLIVANSVSLDQLKELLAVQ